MFAHSNRLTIREDNLHLHATHHASSIVFPGVDWIKIILKADMGERRKTLNIWLKRTQDRGGVEGTRLEAKDTKNIRGQGQPFRGQTLSRQGHRRKCSQKKKIIIIRTSKFFVQVFSKKQNQKISQKTSFSTKNDLQTFKDSKTTAVLEPRTGQFSRT